MKKIFNVGDAVKVIHLEPEDMLEGIDVYDTGVVVMAGNLIQVKLKKNGQTYQFYKYQLANITSEKLTGVYDQITTIINESDDKNKIKLDLIKFISNL